MPQTYAHDAGKRGNLERDDGFDDIQDDAFLYSYDPENRLTKVEYDSDVTDQTAALPMAEYRYDGGSQRGHSSL